jgi:ribonuclease BN (tRNA processing enzyme)
VYGEVLLIDCGEGTQMQMQRYRVAVAAVCTTFSSVTCMAITTSAFRDLLTA